MQTIDKFLIKHFYLLMKPPHPKELIVYIRVKNLDFVPQTSSYLNQFPYLHPFLHFPNFVPSHISFNQSLFCWGMALYPVEKG